MVPHSDQKHSPNTFLLLCNLCMFFCLTTCHKICRKKKDEPARFAFSIINANLFRGHQHWQSWGCLFLKWFPLVPLLQSVIHPKVARGAARLGSYPLYYHVNRIERKKRLKMQAAMVYQSFRVGQRRRRRRKKLTRARLTHSITFDVKRQKRTRRQKKLFFLSIFWFYLKKKMNWGWKHDLLCLRQIL